MKLLFAVIFCLFSLTFAVRDDSSNVLLGLMENNLEEAFKDLALYENRFLNYGDEDEYNAIINELVDRTLENIYIFSKNHSLDPMELQGFDDNFLIARVTLSNGTLGGVSTILRNGDVTVTFQKSKNILDLKIPLKFDSINFAYKFRVVLLLLSHTGKLTGNIDSVKVYLELSFDFNALKAKLNKLSMVNTGHISIHVEGGIIEAVLSLLSELITTVIHPLIIAVIQQVIASVVNNVISTINDVIDKIIHPGATEFIFENILAKYYV